MCAFRVILVQVHQSWHDKCKITSTNWCAIILLIAQRNKRNLSEQNCIGKPLTTVKKENTFPFSRVCVCACVLCYFCVSFVFDFPKLVSLFYQINFIILGRVFFFMFIDFFSKVCGEPQRLVVFSPALA